MMLRRSSRAAGRSNGRCREEEVQMEEIPASASVSTDVSIVQKCLELFICNLFSHHALIITIEPPQRRLQ